MPRRVEGFWFPDTSVWSPGTSSLFSGSSLPNSTPHILKPPHTAQLIIFLLSHYFSRENSESPPFPDDTLLSRIYHNYPFISSEPRPPHISHYTFLLKACAKKFPYIVPQIIFSFPPVVLFTPFFLFYVIFPFLSTSPSCAHTSRSSSVDKPAGHDNTSSISK